MQDVVRRIYYTVRWCVYVRFEQYTDTKLCISPSGRTVKIHIRRGITNNNFKQTTGWQGKGLITHHVLILIARLIVREYSPQLTHRTACTITAARPPAKHIHSHWFSHYTTLRLYYIALCKKPKPIVQRMSDLAESYLRHNHAKRVGLKSGQAHDIWSFPVCYKLCCIVLLYYCF